MARKKQNAQNPVQQEEVVKETNITNEENKQATEATNTELEVFDGDVINANDAEEVVLSDTVCVCYNSVQALEMETPFGTFHINSNSEKFRGSTDTFTLPVAGTYGITKNIPRKAWEWFAKVYRDWGEIQNGLLFACDISEVRTKIKEHKGTVNGFEPLDFAHNDPRLTKGTK